MGASRRPQSHQNPEESRAHHQPSSDLRDKAEALTYCYVDMLQPWPQGKLYLARLHLSVCVCFMQAVVALTDRSQGIAVVKFANLGRQLQPKHAGSTR